MFLKEKIVSILAIAFFSICIIFIFHLSFFVTNRDAKKEIYTCSLMYGFFFSVIEMIEYRNTPNFEISPSRAIGGTLGLIAGFYFGYQFCIWIKIMDDSRFIKLTEPSNINNTGLTGSSNITAIANGFCYGSSEAGRQLGSFLGDILLL